MTGDEAARVVRRKPWRREVMMVGCLMLLITVFGWVQVRSVTQQVADSSREACIQNNVVRVVVGRTLLGALTRAQQEQAAASDPFIRRQASESVLRLNLRLRELRDGGRLIRDCQDDYP